MKKKYLITIIVLVLGLGFLFFRDGEPEQEFFRVKKGDIVKEIFESGVLEKGQKINLGTLTGGEIKKIYVQEGEVVEKGDLLAVLDQQEYLLEKAKAEQNLKAAQAELEILKQGGSEQDIKEAKNQLESAEKSFQLAEQALEQVKEIAAISLKDAYDSAFSLVNQSYITAKDIYNDLETIRDKYFTGFYLSQTYQARDSISTIKRNKETLKDIVDEFDEKEDLPEAEQALKTIEREVENIIDVADSDFYERQFTDTDKQILWTNKTNANGSLANIISLINTIESTKSQNNSNINTAENKKETARSNYITAQDNLERLQTGGRSLEIEAAQARKEALRQSINLIDEKIERSTITAPSAGKIAFIHAKEKEIIQAGESLISFLSDKELQVKVDIYEGDITNIKVGDTALIELAAFPGETFQGFVFSINVADKVKDGVVYYETIIELDELPARARHGMTADITIENIIKHDTLFISELAIEKKEGKSFVQILKNGQLTKREIETGSKGDRRQIEVVSGLEKGEKVLID